MVLKKRNGNYDTKSSFTRAFKPKELIVGSGNFISQIFFLWLFRFIFKVRSSKDLKEFVFKLRKSETADKNDQILDKTWSQEKERAMHKNKQPILGRALCKAFGLTFLLNGILKILWGIALWTGAYWLLKETISYVRAKSTDNLKGHMYALGFLASSVLATIFIQQLLSQSGRLGLRVNKYIYFI